MEETKKKQAKKRTPEEKQLLNRMSYVFSSMSCRGCPYAYFNVAPGVIILTNSTTSKSDEHGDRLINYSVPDLALHIVRFKDTEIENTIRSCLKIPDMGYYCVNTVNLLGLLKKHLMNELSLFTTPSGDTVLAPKGRKTYEAKHIVGWTVENFHVIRELFNYFQQMEIIGTEEHRKTTPHVYRPLNRNPVIIGRIFYEKMVMADFRRSDGGDVFPNCTDEVNIVCLDGLTTVSLREFLPKIGNEPYELNQYAWTVSDAYILSMTIFDNAWVNVRSMRPNILTIPVPKMAVTPTSVLMSLKECEYGG